MARPILEWQDQTPILRGHNLVPIHDPLAGPADGICFDIENDAFWMDERGAKPEDLSAALVIARRKLAQVPRLIPVHSHRFLPSEPCDSGKPVFSVHQTDIIYYGFDLASYLAHEFNTSLPERVTTKAREISFGSKLAR